jgi:hypothetical protein
MRPSIDEIVRVTWRNRAFRHGRCDPPRSLLPEARLATGPLVGLQTQEKVIDALERVISRHERAVVATRATTKKMAQHYPFGWPHVLAPVYRMAA